MTREAFRHQRVATAIATLTLCSASGPQVPVGAADDWASYGGPTGEQHYTPLAQIDEHTVNRLGLAWSLDLPPGNSVSQPIEVDGTVYIATGYSVVRAIDGASGRLLWTYDPDVPAVAGRKLRTGWGSRGLAYLDGRIFVAAMDGRLIALDHGTGKPIWSTQTVEAGSSAYITGAPRAFDGRIVIGNAGADVAAVRGYVTAYDAATGRQLWRFHTVPGNPADGFENDAMAMAAKTWAGEWWKYGGGGTVWNAMSYDPELGAIYIGVGNGAPWNRKIRSADQGDNLFLASIVALDAKTGAYRWHYQVNPGESWDYNAAMDMALATVDIGGKPRKVLMQVPKNGFVYVIDRETGKLVSAEPFVKVTWASRIDVATGRPIENPAARYPNGAAFDLYPGTIGAHSWMPMAFSRSSGLLYIPTSFLGSRFSDRGIPTKDWTRYPGLGGDGGAYASIITDDPAASTSALTAWNPVTQKLAWRVPTPGPTNGGVMATAGGLVFQGRVDGTFAAYAAASGRPLWSFAAQAPVIAPPISYRIKGRQYVTVLSGLGTGTGALGPLIKGLTIDYRTQARRVLTFALDGKATIPAAPALTLSFPADPGFSPTAAPQTEWAIAFGRRCAHCHGIGAVAAGSAPDLRASAIPQSIEAFTQVVRDGALVSQGMPRFEELDDRTLAGIQTYIRTQAALARGAPTTR